MRYLPSRACPSGKRRCSPLPVSGDDLRTPIHPPVSERRSCSRNPGHSACGSAQTLTGPPACALTDSITHAGQPPSLGGAPSRSTHRMVDREGSCVGSILPFVTRVVFDDAATRIMGEAFDAACEELRGTGQPLLAREVMAKRIIDAASAGERDVRRLRDAALSALNG